MLKNRLYVTALVLAVVNVAEWAYPALSDLVPPAETITVYEHGRATPLDPNLLWYPLLLRGCERAVTHAGPLRPPPRDASVAEGLRHGDAVEVRYAVPRTLLADGGWTIAVDRLLIPLDRHGGDATPVLSGSGAYHQAFAGVPAGQLAAIRRYAADLAAIERTRDARRNCDQSARAAP